MNNNMHLLPSTILLFGLLDTLQTLSKRQASFQFRTSPWLHLIISPYVECAPRLSNMESMPHRLHALLDASGIMPLSEILESSKTAEGASEAYKLTVLCDAATERFEWSLAIHLVKGPRSSSTKANLASKNMRKVAVTYVLR